MRLLGAAPSLLFSFESDFFQNVGLLNMQARSLHLDSRSARSNRLLQGQWRVFHTPKRLQGLRYGPGLSKKYSGKGTP
jgi:hypothetical protein